MTGHGFLLMFCQVVADIVQFRENEIDGCVGALLRTQCRVPVPVLAVLERLVGKRNGRAAETDTGNENPEPGCVLGELHLPMDR